LYAKQLHLVLVFLQFFEAPYAHTFECLFACLGVEIALGARKVINTDEDDSKAMMPSSTTEKKSSFSFFADDWLAQRETVKKMDIGPVTAQDDELSSVSTLCCWLVK